MRLGRVRLVGRSLSLLMLGFTLAAWAATRSSPGVLTFERFRAYSLTSREGVLILSVTERLRSDHATGREFPVALSPEWRVHAGERSSADGFLVRLVLGAGQ